jgi:hypothetical protein
MGDIAPADQIISRDRLKEKQTIAELSWRPAICVKKERGQKYGKLSGFLTDFLIFYFAINLRFGVLFLTPCWPKLPLRGRPFL